MVPPPLAESAYNRLKRSLTSTPILALLDFDRSFIVGTDASRYAMGVVLTQSGSPIAFFNKSFTPFVCSASTYVKEMEAIVEVVKKWRHYLLDCHFTIVIDHDSLKHLLT